MINRALIRIKVIQIIYSYYKSEGNSIPAAVKELFHSFDKTYQLYYHLLWMSVEITRYCEQRIDAKKNKLRPTDEDLHPNTRFVDNAFIRQLSQNKPLNDLLKEFHVAWENDENTVKSLYEDILKQDFYEEYMTALSTDYVADKDIWKKIYKKVFLASENLDNAIEDQSIYWTDDLEVIISFIVKTIKRFTLENGESQSLLPEFNSEEDSGFAEKLIRNTLENGTVYREMIDAHTKNWELDRIAFMDIVIMEAAISEIMSFPTIPVNVTLNEYIEISKSYSTEKSAIFINGILDGIVKELKSRKELIKVVKI